MIFSTLLQEALPIAVGPVGTILLSVIAVALGATNAYQWRKSTQASQWQGAALAYKEELVAVRERATRLETENITLVRTATDLKAKTDLSSLERLNLEADRRNQEVHERIVLSLNSLMDGNITRHAQLTAVLLENTSAIKVQGERMMNEFELHRGAFANMIRALKEKTGDNLKKPRKRVEERDVNLPDGGPSD